MELKHLTTFKEVARTLSFSRAGESLGYAQSTVTLQIQTLEKELGAPLFNRLGKRIELTEIGEHLLSYASRLISLEAEARISVQRAIERPSGKIVVDGADAVLVLKLPRVLREFRRRYPEVEVSVNIRLVDETVDFEELVRNGIVDCALVYTDQIGDDLEHERISVVQGQLLAAPFHPLANKNPISPEDLDGEVVFFMIPDCPYRRMFGASLARFQDNSIHNFTARNFQAIKQQLLLGKGISFLGHFEVASELARGDLVCLEPDWMELPELSIWFVWNRERWRSPALEAFHEVVREFFP